MAAGRSGREQPAGDAAALAAVRFLGLDPASAPGVEVLRDAKGRPSRIAVRCPIDGRQELIIEVFPTGSGAGAWIAGPALSVSYRPLAGGESPFGHPSARNLLDRIEAAVSRQRAAGPASPEVQAVLLALGPGRPGGSAAPARAPEPWREILDFFHESRLPAAQEAVLLAALEAGIVRHLAGVPSATVPEVARACGCEERALTVFLRALVALGMVEPTGEGAFRLVPDAAVLLGPAEPLLRMNRMLRELWRDHLVTALRTGRLTPSRMPFDRRDLWEAMIGALGFLQLRRPAQRELAAVRGGGPGRARHLMDVGAGSGEMSAALLLEDPELHVVAVDYPLALPAARACYERHGLLDRVTLAAGEFYEPAWAPPGGCDAAFLANTVHVAGPDENRLLLRKLHDALPAGGGLVVVERVLEPGNVPTAMNDLLWSFFTDRGRAYTLDEVLDLVAEAGFAAARTSTPRDGIAHVYAVKPAALAPRGDA